MICTTEGGKIATKNVITTLAATNPRLPGIITGAVMTIGLQFLVVIFIVIMCLVCIEKAVEKAIDDDRKAIAHEMRMLAVAASSEHFDIFPSHLEEMATRIERGEL